MTLRKRASSIKEAFLTTLHNKTENVMAGARSNGKPERGNRFKLHFHFIPTVLSAIRTFSRRQVNLHSSVDDHTDLIRPAPFPKAPEPSIPPAQHISNKDETRCRTLRDSPDSISSAPQEEEDVHPNTN
jgi:phosphatidylserine/phosphatidylglycerophosphate/cardiolipin synthase-like enzyme